MRQIGTLIVILFIIISLGIVGLGYIQRNQPQPEPTAIELTLLANPMAHAWITNAVAQFNQGNTRLMDNFIITIDVNPTPMDDMTAWREAWNDTTRPDIWLASSSLAVEYRGYPFIVEDRVILAKTPMIWVASALADNAITQNGEQPLDWGTIQPATVAGTWANFGVSSLQGNVNIAFAPPDSSLNGLMALYGAQAYYLRSLNLNAVPVNQDFLAWLAPIVDSVPNFNTIGTDVATFMLTRGTSVNIALMPEAQFLTQISTFMRTRPIQVSYPEYPMVFDFSLTWWDDVNAVEPDIRQARIRAIATFANLLLEPTQQAQLSQYGLRPINLPIGENDNLFRQGLDVGITYDPILDSYLLQATNARGSQLLTWFAQERVR
mgnify:CR=1 FL=1